VLINLQGRDVDEDKEDTRNRILKPVNASNGAVCNEKKQKKKKKITVDT
jgi:hypothetical protein